MSTTPESTVRAFFDRLSAGGRLADAIDEYVADDCVWENSGLPAVRGRAAVHAQMDQFVQGFGLHALVVDTRVLAVSGNVVLTERVDHVDTADGTRVLSIEMAGAMEVVDGRITRWSDYFDPRPLLP
ncbi:MAG: nuclear transport factor 2 family protein [Solirubrobacteraceae bacterium]|nr:nuclear transport factor 2 family protein [Solirubrobacteraceae bacterium]